MRYFFFFVALCCVDVSAMAQSASGGYDPTPREMAIRRMQITGKMSNAIDRCGFDWKTKYNSLTAELLNDPQVGLGADQIEAVFKRGWESCYNDRMCSTVPCDQLARDLRLN